MSNARNLANLMGTNTLVPQSKVNLSLGASDLPSGTVLQVLQDTFTGTDTHSGQTYADTGLEISITPTSTNSKIYISSVVKVAWDNGAAKVAVSLFRDSTEIFVGDANGNRLRATAALYMTQNSLTAWPVPISYLDSPSTTSAVTYKVKYKNMDPQGTVAVNRPIDTWTDSVIFASEASSIVVMEIAG